MKLGLEISILLSTLLAAIAAAGQVAPLPADISPSQTGAFKLIISFSPTAEVDSITVSQATTLDCYVAVELEDRLVDYYVPMGFSSYFTFEQGIVPIAISPMLPIELGAMTIDSDLMEKPVQGSIFQYIFVQYLECPVHASYITLAKITLAVWPEEFPRTNFAVVNQYYNATLGWLPLVNTDDTWAGYPCGYWIGSYIPEIGSATIYVEPVSTKETSWDSIKSFFK